MFHQRSFQLVLFTFAIFSALSVCAQETGEPDPIKWALKAQTANSSSGKNQFTLELRATIDRGWHLYSTEKVEGGPSPTRISLVTGQSFEIAGEIDSPAPRSAYDPNFQVATEFYEGEVAFTIPIKSTASVPGEQVRVQVRYQTCTPTICLPPKLLELETRLNGEETKSNSSTEAKPVPNKPGANGTTVADFDFVDFTGKSRRFSEFRGRVVLLDFWASWCSPCLADIPQLKNIYLKYHAQGFEIIGLDSETLGQKDVDAEFAKDAQMKAREIVSTRGVSWTQATAASSLPIAGGSFGIESLPAKILIDRNGQVVGRIKDVANLEELLPALLKAAN
jgi:thiol-disulfide isomerase/thioredoxin